MAEEESAVDLSPRPRPALLTYKKKKPFPVSPAPAATAQQLPKVIPDLSICHCCGLDYEKSGANAASNAIHIVKSPWRLLLLCGTCLGRIKSGEICSYCLQNQPDDVAIDGDSAELESVNCSKCSCRVHFCCIPREHCYDFAMWEKLRNAGNGRCFTCIDCLPVPKLLLRKRNVSVFELIGKEKAASAVNGEKRVEDKDLAMQLHLEINGSQRVSRNKVNLSLVPDKPKRSKIELYRQRLSLGSIGMKNRRVINARYSGLSIGFNSVVLALASTNCDFEPLSQLRERCRLSRKYSKRKQMQNENGNDGSRLDGKIGGEAVSKLSGSGSRNQNGSDRYLKKYAKRKTFEGMVVSNNGTQNGGTRYGDKYYKRRSCQGKLLNSNASENIYGHHVGLKQDISDRFLNKYFKRRLTVKREDGTCVGTCTVYGRNEGDRYFKKYSKTRKRKDAMGGEQCNIDRYMKKYSKRRATIEVLALTEESQYNGGL